MKEIDCCYNCGYCIGGDRCPDDNCAFCHADEFVCTLAEFKYVQPNNICEKWKHDGVCRRSIMMDNGIEELRHK